MKDYAADEQRVVQFILKTFPNTAAPAGGFLKHPYVSPGGPYAGSLWDWDSYWTLLAMLEYRKAQGQSCEELRTYARGTLFNFLENQGEDGALPIMIQESDQDPFDCLKSADHNMAKPFVGQLALLLFQHGLLETGELRQCLPRIRAFHQCYDCRYLHRETGLVVWAKDWGIGVDDDPTTWGRPDRSCANIFLNSFFYRDLQAAHELCQTCGLDEIAADYERRLEELRQGILTYCWDSREKAFFSLDVQCREKISPHRIWGALNVNLDAFWHCLKIKILSWNCILPFWCGLGSDEQFAAFRDENLVAGRLLSAYGVRSLSYDEPMYAPEVKRGNPSNWLGPVWIIVNYITWDTLRQRGYQNEANQLARTIIQLLAQDLEATGSFHEYYSPETGRAVCGDNFMSWDALACLMAETSQKS